MARHRRRPGGDRLICAPGQSVRLSRSTAELARTLSGLTVTLHNQGHTSAAVTAGRIVQLLVRLARQLAASRM